MGSRTGRRTHFCCGRGFGSPPPPPSRKSYCCSRCRTRVARRAQPAARAFLRSNSFSSLSRRRGAAGRRDVPSRAAGPLPPRDARGCARARAGGSWALLRRRRRRRVDGRAQDPRGRRTRPIASRRGRGLRDPIRRGERRGPHDGGAVGALRPRARRTPMGRGESRASAHARSDPREDGGDGSRSGRRRRDRALRRGPDPARRRRARGVLRSPEGRRDRHGGGAPGGPGPPPGAGRPPGGRALRCADVRPELACPVGRGGTRDPPFGRIPDGRGRPGGRPRDRARVREPRLPRRGRSLFRVAPGCRPLRAAAGAPLRERLRTSLPLFWALVLAFLPLRAFLGSGGPVGRDLLFYFFPLKAHLVEAVARGELPWVDRFRWGGSPLLGAPSAAPFDPANVLFLALPLGAAMKAWILLHLGLALAGFAAFGRRLGLSRGPAALAGLIFALGGTTVSLAAFPAALSALSILPWFAAFAFDTVRMRGKREAAKLAVAAALILIATPPEFVFFALCVAVAVFFAARGEGETWRQEARPLALLAVSALLAAGLGAIALLPGAATAARSIRSSGGGMGPGAAAMKPLAWPRLPELLVDRAVADWTVAASAPCVPDYPYLPSLTPGRVAWALVLAGLLRKGPGRIAAAACALFGTLLALGDATPVFGLAAGALPPLGWIRYPEKYMILAGFGLAWLAALGLSRLALALSPRALTIVLPLLALAVFLDREEITRRLSPVEDAAVLTQRPPLLAALPEASGDAPPPRLFFNDAYQPAPIYDTRDIGAASRVGCETLLPAYASLFGVGYQFEVDYDLSLSAEAFEWTRLLSRAVPETPSLALRFVRGAGVSAIVKSDQGKDGRYRPHLMRIGNSVPPYRFAAHVVASADARAVFARLLEDGFSADTAYVDAALPGVPASPATGRILSAAHRPSGLFLDVEVDGPAPGFLVLYRLREAAEEATRDGRPIPVAQVAFGFAGLPVPPGRHALRLRPDTRWVKIGALISALTALTLAAALLAPRRRASSGST